MFIIFVKNLSKVYLVVIKEFGIKGILCYFICC